MDKTIKAKADEDFLEIKLGDMFLKIPNNIADVRLAKNLLSTFETILEENPNIPLLVQDEIQDEIQDDEVPEETEVQENPQEKSEEDVISLEIPEVPEEREEGIPDRCPKCEAKVKTSRVKTRENLMYQIVKCKKNWLFGNCNFKKEYTFKIS